MNIKITIVNLPSNKMFPKSLKVFCIAAPGPVFLHERLCVQINQHSVTQKTRKNVPRITFDPGTEKG